MLDVQLHEIVDQIRDMIQAGSYAEAISHCLYVLEHYPKHVQTHVLLGDACLERRAYRDAQDAFQRALSADPENLMARVGMGVIYNELGGLEESIWEWERAFELAPGNLDVRQQLQELLSRQTGVSPARLRLNRAALARLYMRNGLYERAITEFQIALAEHPARIDLRVALAEALWHEGQHLEALDSCHAIVQELPSCLKANLILGEIWMRTGHEEKAEEKLELVKELDPESGIAIEIMGEQSPLDLRPAYLPLPSPDKGLPFAPLPGTEVSPREGPPGPPFEKAKPPPVDAAEILEAAEEMPAWVRDLELAVEEPAAPPSEAAVEAEPVPDELPEWLRDIEEAFAEAEPIPTAIPSDTEPPTWLRELEDEAQEAFEAEMAEARPRAKAPEEELAPARPDEQPEAAPEAVPAAEEAELPDWLRDIMAEVPVPAAEPEVIPPEAVAEPEVVAPEAIAEPEVVAPEAIVEPEALAPEVVAEPEVVAPEAIVEPEAVAPEVVAEPEVAPEAAVEPEAVPWMAALEPAAVEPEAAFAEPELPAAAVEIPPSLRALVEAGILDDDDIAAAMAEMTPEALAAQQAVEIPEWLQDLAPVSVTAPPAVAPAPEEAPPTPEPEEVAPPLEPELEPEEGPPPLEAEPAPEVPPSLRPLVDLGILSEADVTAALAEMTPEELAAQHIQEFPDWLRDLAPEEPAPPTAVVEVAPSVVVEPEVLRAVEPEALELEPEPIPEPPAIEAELVIEPPVLPAVEPEALELEPEPIPEPPAIEAELVIEPEVLPAVEPEALELELEPPAIEAELVVEPEAEVVELEPEVAPAVEPEVMELEPEPPAIEAELVVEPEAEVVELEPEPEVLPPPAEPEPVELEPEPIPEPPAIEAELVVEPEAEVVVPEPEPELPPAVEPEVVEPEVAVPALESMLAELAASPRNHTLRLQVARDLHVAGQLEEALDHYERLVNAGKLLPEVLQHLPALADATRERYRAWQILGDAYMKTDRLNEALEAYKEARRALNI